MKEFAIIFDMDGVIVDNHLYHRKAIDLFFKKFNISFTDEQLKKHVWGRTNHDFMRYAFGTDLSWEETHKLSEEKEALYRKIYEKNIVPLKGLKEFLKSIQKNGIKRAVATSGCSSNVNFVLEKTGIKDFFEIVVDETMVETGKPSPEVYFKTATKLDTEPSRCVVFEDSPSGMKAAKTAGMKVVGVLTELSKEEAVDADFTIKDFSEINLDIIRNKFFK